MKAVASHRGRVTWSCPFQGLLLYFCQLNFQPDQFLDIDSLWTGKQQCQQKEIGWKQAVRVG